jgi:hypothetical protein
VLFRSELGKGLARENHTDKQIRFMVLISLQRLGYDAQALEIHREQLEALAASSRNCAMRSPEARKSRGLRHGLSRISRYGGLRDASVRGCRSRWSRADGAAFAPFRPATFSQDPLTACGRQCLRVGRYATLRGSSGDAPEPAPRLERSRQRSRCRCLCGARSPDPLVCVRRTRFPGGWTWRVPAERGCRRK